jgi:hypothetical protein
MVNGGKFSNSFLSNYLSQPFDIWHTALTRVPILWDSISGLSLITLLFIDFIKFSTLMVKGRKFL